MGRDESDRAAIKVAAECALFILGGGALMMWGWTVNEEGGVIVGGMVTGTFLWQWVGWRDPEHGASIGMIMLLAVLAAAMVLLFLYGR